MKKTLQQTAFTIIEMIFVIAIIGVLTSIGISYLRRSTFDAKVDTAAQQIQQLLTAASVYYQNNDASWPKSCQQLVPAYVAQNALTNPWGETYTCQQHTSKKNVFQVLTSTKQKTAQQIADQLPTSNIDPSECTSDDCQVSAEISAPATIASPIIIGGMGVGKNGDMVKAVCPKGKIAKFNTALAEINATPYFCPSFGGGGCLPMTQMKTSAAPCTTLNNTTSCQLNINFDITSLRSSQAKIFYIAACNSSS